MALLPETSGSSYPTPRQIESGESQAGGINGLWNEHAKAAIERTNWLKAAVLDAAPPSAVMFFARNTAPTGWLKANGAALSRTTYASLFAAIGTTYGAGDGSTTFNLPQVRGEFLRGWDDGFGTDAGRAFGSAQVDEIKSHRHGMATATTYQGGTTRTGPSPGAGTISTNYSENTGGTETRPRNIAFLACIKF